MNTYFYAASTAKCKKNCSYETCSKRCLSLLKKLQVADNLVILPGGSKLQTRPSMELRSGDIIILYAGTREDLDTLVTLKDFFENFRIILIVGRDDLKQYAPHYLLSPRYTTAINQNISRLGAVIDRMSMPTGPAYIENQREGQYYE